MILRTEDLKNVVTHVLSAVDSNSLSKITECVELIGKGNTFYMKVTNGEYFAQFKLIVSEDLDFHATVSAELFLKLINKTTSETVSFSVEDNYLLIIGNGSYKLPLVYENDALLTLSSITLNNITTTFSVSSSVLKSVLRYNTRELAKGEFNKVVQKMYYMDETGAITFTSGACVNKFSLNNPIKLLLTSNIVNLFHIFNDDEVQLTLAQDDVNGHTQTKLMLEDSHFSLTTLLNNSDELFSSFPVEAIRNMVDDDYDFSVTINKDVWMQCIERMTLFNDVKVNNFSRCVFTSSSLELYDGTGNNVERILYSSGESLDDLDYTCTLDINDVKLMLGGYGSDYINIKFGNHRNIILYNSNIYCVIPEVVV